MNKQKVPEDIKVNVKLKLAALWVSFMFLYIYVDYLHLYMPRKIEDISNGRVFEFDITQGFIFTVLSLATIPIMMIFLSVVLAARANRLTNMIVATGLIPYMLFNLAGEAWIHMIFAAVAEVALLCLIIRYAWKWTQAQTSNRQL
ncbi:hypothetical protein CNR22_03950 [Sphingobacteriaceae bacterium]|nr:hypothetical protein CNR22_03950 [Sphingobacteriaceae bacterium]